MIAIAILLPTIRNNYALIMDADRNPLRRLPPAQRFQTMIYLSIMWTTIFCAAFGLWFWYGHLVVAHMLVVLGFILTSITFEMSGRRSIIPVKIKKLPLRATERH